MNVDPKDCFANKRHRCSALKVKNCEGCTFYKTKGQFLQDQQNALDRILSMDADRRDNIIKTYYGGKLEVIT